jgi:hypothetical protein
MGVFIYYCYKNHYVQHIVRKHIIKHVNLMPVHLNNDPLNKSNGNVRRFS